MIEHKKVIKEITGGNGQQFSVKEILMAQIKENTEFHNYVRDKFEKGTQKITENREAIKAVNEKTDNILKYGVTSLIVVLGGITGGLVWLGKIVLGRR